MTKSDASVQEEALPVFESVTYEAPKVNLLPPEIGERRQLRRLQAGLIAIVLASAGVVGALYVQAGSGQAAAQQRLDLAKTQQSTLQTQTARLNYVSAQKAQIDAARSSLRTAMGSEVLWSKTLDQVRLRLPDGVRYSSVAFARQEAVAVAPTVKGATATAGAAAAPTIPADVIATATFTGIATDLNAVANELDQLAKVPGLNNVYLSTVTKPKSDGTTPGTATFTATANVTNSLLSHRYDTLTGVSK